LEKRLFHSAISFKLKIKNETNKFAFAYKPPKTNDELFLDHIDTILNKLNLINNTLIIGDLNMDWLTNKSTQLKEFCHLNNLNIWVNDPTRIQTNKNGLTTSTLIDVVLHDKKIMNKISVIDFALSDHIIVLTECKFESNTNCDSEYRMKRKITPKINKLIIEEI